MLVTIVFLLDIVFTSLIVAHYETFKMGDTTSEFLYQTTVFPWIMAVQLIDIVLNFFKIHQAKNQDDMLMIDEPLEVTKKYLK